VEQSLRQSGTVLNAEPGVKLTGNTDFAECAPLGHVLAPETASPVCRDNAERHLRAALRGPGLKAAGARLRNDVSVGAMLVDVGIHLSQLHIARALHVRYILLLVLAVLGSI
jgi:hypothetical protein